MRVGNIDREPRHLGSNSRGGQATDVTSRDGSTGVVSVPLRPPRDPRRPELGPERQLRPPTRALGGSGDVLHARPIRRAVPPIAGLDLAPMIAIVLLSVLQRAVTDLAFRAAFL